MPVPSRTHRAEAKYNVTTEFPHLGLHSAAATGNIGLINYALTHGQPINSVLDGVLPLHAACSSGNDFVVQLLIEQGADVNAPRLPRRYSNDKNRDTSAPIVGTSGSTPLHFAAANGHSNVVSMLIQNGAHPNRADKHGVTPEMLTRENGWLECADLLRDATVEKEKERKERELELEKSHEGLGEDGHCILSSLHGKDNHSIHSSHHGSPPAGSYSRFGGRGLARVKLKPPSTANDGDSVMSKEKDSGEHGDDHDMAHLSRERLMSFPPASDVEASGSKRLHVKRSVDNILLSLKSTVNNLSEVSLPRGASHNTTPGNISFAEPTPPPLGEYTFYPVSTQSTDDLSERRPSLPHIYETTRPHKSTASLARVRRPRSAGTGAEEAPSPPPHPQRKLSSKYSLLNLFKKPGEVSASPTPEQSSFEASSMSPSPSPGPPRPATPSKLPQSSQPPPPPPPQSIGSVPSDSSVYSRNRYRIGSDASAPSAVELHYALSQHSHGRSGSGVSIADETASSSPPTRPGILRAHGRSSSSGQSQNPLPQSPFRALRFDSSSSSGSGKPRSSHRMDLRQSSSPARGLRSNSLGSLKSNGRPGSPGSQVQDMETLPESSASATHEDEEDLPIVDVEEEDEDEYGSPISREIEPPSVSEKKSHRSPSLASSPPLLSPILSAGITTTPSGTEFPFSINQPPPEDDSESQLLTVPRAPFFSKDGRLRGDSISTMSSDTSANPLLTFSGLTATSSGSLSSPPAHSYLGLQGLGESNNPASSPVKPIDAEYMDISEVSPQYHGIDLSPMDAPNAVAASLSERRAHTPLDIDIRSISSHAQAEALVQRAQQNILDLDNTAAEGILTSSPPPSQGWTTLSARLAAYGESLALERRLKKEEEEKARGGTPMPPSELEFEAGSLGAKSTSLSTGSRYDSLPSGGSSKGPTRGRRGRGGLDRQASLEQKSSSRPHQPKRPNTAGEVSNDPTASNYGSFFPKDHTARTHHSHHSASAIVSHPSEDSVLTRASPLEGDSSDSSESSHNQVRRYSKPVPFSPPIVHSRTPAPDMEKTSCDSTVEGIRPSTASPSTDLFPMNSKHEHARHIANADKLSKMGFSTLDGWGGTVSGSPPPARHKSPSRFGGFKSLVQTLKGK